MVSFGYCPQTTPLFRWCAQVAVPTSTPPVYGTWARVPTMGSLGPVLSRPPPTLGLGVALLTSVSLPPPHPAFGVGVALSPRSPPSPLGRGVPLTASVSPPPPPPLLGAGGRLDGFGLCTPPPPEGWGLP